MSTEQNYAGISFEAVQKATGKTWSEWLALLDAAGAKKMTHPEIVSILGDRHGVRPWWQQMLTVGYEQARSLRAKHQRPDGYSVSRSKTMPVPAAAIFSAWKDKRKRARWLADPDITIRKATEQKSLHITWSDGETSVEVMLYDKGPGKTQITVQHSRLATAKQAESMKQYWSEQLARLQAILEK